MITRRELEQIAELAPRVVTYFTAIDSAGQTVWDRIGLCMSGHPKAASWDNGPRSDPAFCWNHQQDVSICHNDGHVCFGDPMSGPSDPTGEAALRADRAADVERQCHDDIRTLVRILERLEDAGSKYPPTRSPNDYEKELTSGSDPQCESCQRFKDDRKKPYWSAPMLNGSGTPYRTTLKDTLPQPLYLCWSCCRHSERKGLLPNEQEIRDHHEKGRMVCRHEDRKDNAA